MKKLLILVLIALLVALAIFLGIKGIKIGNFEILGIKGIQDKNDDLDLKIKQAAKLVEKDYRQAVSDVEANAKKLQEEKKNYEDMITIAGEDTQLANQIEKYEIETLWVRLGNHATSEGVIMQMDVMRGVNSAQDVYDLRFTATGSYISITDFISAIENDSTLGFKIEEFSMKPAGEDLQATFVCKDISIKDVSAITSTPNNINTEDGNTTNTTNTTNSTNATNTNSTANTTNATNKTTTNTNVAQ